MSNCLFENGRDAFATAGVNWSSDTISAALLDLTQSDNCVRQITAASNASPIVLTTAVAHGYSAGDIVTVSGVLGNLAANGDFYLSAASGSSLTLQCPPIGGGTNTTGSAAYTSGGRVVNRGPSTSSKFWSDLDACLVGTKTNLSGESTASGILNASTLTFSSVSGNACQAIAIFKDTGTNTTSRLIAYIDGLALVTVAANASSSATSIAVDPLPYGIANGTVLTFSVGGKSATLTAGAVAGARSLTVSALANAINAGDQAQYAGLTSGSASQGLPVTPNGNNIVVTWDTGANKIAKL